MIDVSVVLLTYREHPDVLRACFASLAQSSDVTFDVFLIDNGGSDATRRLFAEYFPEGTYVRNSENRGFAAGVNQGMRLATGRYVLLLNPDTEVAPHVLAAMVDHMDADRDVGIGSVLMVYPDGRLQESIRRFPTLCNQVVTLLKLPHLFPRLTDRYMMRDGDPYATQDVDSIMGACMMIRRELIDAIGMFDERYFIWFEEVDYCKMARDAGWKVRHYADVRVVHHKGHTFNRLATVQKQRWMRQSMRAYMRKHYGVFPWLLLWACAPLFVLLAYLAAAVKKG